jgi:hypothetical protein
VARPNADPTGDLTSDRMAVTIAEAADRLGVTSEAVRMRLKRATLAGEKRDGRWVVYLPTPTQQDGTGDHTAPERPSQQPTEQATERDPTPDPTPLVAVYESLVASQREEIAFLRRELETRTDELQRRDVLLREALTRFPQLPAGEQRAGGDDEVAQPSRNGIAAPGANGEAPARVVGHRGPRRASPQGVEASAGSAPQKAPRRAWWAFWRGDR